MKSGSETEDQVIAILVQDQFRSKISDQILLSCGETTLLLDGVTDLPSLTIMITDDEEMMDMN